MRKKIFCGRAMAAVLAVIMSLSPFGAMEVVNAEYSADNFDIKCRLRIM